MLVVLLDIALLDRVVDIEVFVCHRHLFTSLLFLIISPGRQHVGGFGSGKEVAEDWQGIIGAVDAVVVLPEGIIIFAAEAECVDHQSVDFSLVAVVFFEVIEHVWMRGWEGSPGTAACGFVLGPVCGLTLYDIPKGGSELVLVASVEREARTRS